VELFRRLAEVANVPEDTNVPEDAESLLAPLLAPEYRIEAVVTAVTDKTYYGAVGCVEWLNDMSDAFAEGARYEVEAIVAHGDDFVVGRVAFVGTGARSGAPLRLRWLTVTWFHDGKATRSAGYANRYEALKAVGLKP
jgi:ketosteroid isomerase-like protein